MKVFIFFSICIAATVCIRKPTHDERSILRSESRKSIVGGRPAEQSPDKKYFEFPWMVSLHYKGYYRCSSFLITPKVVMTAAQCLFYYKKEPEDPKDFNAYVGTVNRDGPEKEVTFTEFIIHEKYVRGDYDIAIMKLAKPVVLRYNIQPICLPTKDSVYVNTTAQSMGWGSTTGLRFQKSKTLQTATEEIPTNAMCNFAYKNGYKDKHTYVNKRHICAGGDGKKAMCGGDAGGPLVALNETEPVAIGIASFGRGECVQKGLPGVFTATAMYTDWIVENMGEDADDLCFVNKTSTSTT